MIGNEIHKQFTADKQISLSNFNKLVEAVQLLLDTKFSPSDFVVVDLGHARSVRLANKPSDEQEDFMPLSIKDFTVYFDTGYVTQGGNFKEIGAENSNNTPPGTPVSCGGTKNDYHYIYVQGSKADLSDAVIAPSSVATYPVSTNDTWKHVIWYCWISGSTVVLCKARTIDKTAFYTPP
jgi:hypothetical protein